MGSHREKYAFQLADADVILTFELGHYFLDSKMAGKCMVDHMDR